MTIVSYSNVPIQINNSLLPCVTARETTVHDCHQQMIPSWWSEKQAAKKKKRLVQTVNFTNNFDPYAAICMSYSENEDLRSYHKNISLWMLIQSERHIKEGHLIYRWMQIYPPDMVLLLFGCSTSRSTPQLQKTVSEWKKHTATNESQYGAATWVTAELLIW
jgi:hypothetical protein